MDSTTSKLRNSWISGDFAHSRSAAYRAYCRAPGRPQTAAFGRDYYEQRRSVTLADERGLRGCVMTSKAAIGNRDESDTQTYRVEMKELAITRRSHIRPSTCRIRAASKSPERIGKTRKPTTSRLVKSCQTEFDRWSFGRIELESSNKLKGRKTSEVSSESMSIPDDAEIHAAVSDVTLAVSDVDANANCQSARQLVTYHYVDRSKRSLQQLKCCAVNNDDGIIGDRDRPAETCNVSSYCVEVQGEGRLTTPGLADYSAPENQILVNLLRKQLTLSHGHCTQDDESLSLHLESLNSLMSQLINAKPPTGHLYYFAYGPDINTERFKSCINRLHTDTTWVFLYGFKLLSSQETWPKLVYSPQSAVEGRLYVITRQEAVLLDSHVGTSQRFLTILLPVWLVDNDNTSSSSSSTAEYCLPALIHVPHDLLLE